MSAGPADEAPDKSSDKSPDKVKSPPPIVIDRLHFKEDVDGYLTAADRKQLYLFDLAATDA